MSRKDSEEYKLICKRATLKHKYGLTIEDVERLKQSQGNCCYICGKEKTGRWQQGLVVDHCHESGQVRGLLCTSCNTKLGWYERHILEVDSYLARYYKRSA